MPDVRLNLFFFSARELRHGLENLDDKPRQVHVKQSKWYCAWAGETLHKVEVRDHIVVSSALAERIY